MTLPRYIPSIDALVNSKTHEERQLATWDKLRFYLRFFELITCTIASGFAYRCIIASGNEEIVQSIFGYSVHIVRTHHYYFLAIGILSTCYCFFGMFQTLAQGHQYKLPKWLIYFYITMDLLLFFNFIVVTNLLLVGTPVGPIDDKIDKNTSNMLALRVIACQLGSKYEFNWKEKMPGAIDYPSICTFSTVTGILGYIIFGLFLLSLGLTLYLRYRWKNLRLG